ncbi:MAG: hypothetical protein M3294_06545, partial [Pseudomonadota bacterium]|nr:hypothetical protein [Pseudomonadota bacterium]
VELRPVAARAALCTRLRLPVEGRVSHLLACGLKADAETLNTMRYAGEAPETSTSTEARHRPIGFI